ncbi:PREDICTED: uncharacterized protein LOC104773737 [Camelina sativa]|uniref:Uncharacterized protein LOC104773737 n=1 Tax=Camelina sativa TaxID=90675 RepID=A0ABM0Y7C6_CAMSA|nr:PREDICTED: uncharacterized protein LOC104773737 [Camelina sativa]XP_010496691.1 PREDICTED: uncharacterized protein LOC104773737 [Camelina sativa]
MKNKVSLLESILLFLSLSELASSKFHGNPAHEMVSILNRNRTSQKLTNLNENPGLGCMALQYVEFCEGNCNVNNTLGCEPPEDDFTQVFAPNCGVELPTFGAITGHILGCSSKYVAPEVAFSDILFRDNKTLSVLRNRSHTEVGVGVARLHKGTFFWCLLFSDGGTNSSFALEDNGRGIKQRRGCYSGSAFPCSNAHMICMRLLNSFLGILLSSSCLFKQHLTS